MKGVGMRGESGIGRWDVLCHDGSNLDFAFNTESRCVSKGMKKEHGNFNASYMTSCIRLPNL
jgi:hypothetical protein